MAKSEWVAKGREVGWAGRATSTVQNDMLVCHFLPLLIRRVSLVIKLAHQSNADDATDEQLNILLYKILMILFYVTPEAEVPMSLVN